MSSVDTLSRRAVSAASQPIGELMRKALAHPELISLAAGFVDQVSLPVESTRKPSPRYSTRLARGQAALQYGTPAGYLPLREAVLQQLLRQRRRALAGQHIAIDQV